MPPFSEYQALLAHPGYYRVTQALGAAMRAAQVQAFQFRSVRYPVDGNNVALYAPSAFAENKPRHFRPEILDELRAMPRNRALRGFAARSCAQ